MGTATAVSRGATAQEAVGRGIAGGLAGGVVFGVMMTAMGMIAMVGMLVGSESAAVGWVVHLAISAFIGATFGLLTARRPAGTGALVGLGAAYGLLWWVLGALLLMPARMGMPPFQVDTMALNSLIGHVAYGLVLGLVVALLARRRRHA